MFKRITKATGLALLLGASAWANDGASFLVGPSFLYSTPSMGVSGVGPGLHFDLHMPIKSVNGLSIGARSFLATCSSNKFVNDTANNISKDLDRKFYFAGVAIGPKFKTPGDKYMTGTVGLLVAANYAVNTTYADNTFTDREVKSETADLSLGGEGSFGGGMRLGSGLNVELNILAQGASSEGAPGIIFSIGPKLTVGFAL